MLTDHLIENHPDSWTTYAHLIELGNVFQSVENQEKARSCFEEGFNGLRQTSDNMPLAEHSLFEHCLKQLTELSMDSNPAGQNKELLAQQVWWTEYKSQLRR